MNQQSMSDLLSADPFRPFRLTLTTGETIDVTDPGPVFVMPFAMHLFGINRRGSHLAEWSKMISLRHIVKVEQLEASNAA